MRELISRLCEVTYRIASDPSLSKIFQREVSRRATGPIDTPDLFALGIVVQAENVFASVGVVGLSCLEQLTTPDSRTRRLCHVQRGGRSDRSVG